MGDLRSISSNVFTSKIGLLAAGVLLLAACSKPPPTPTGPVTDLTVSPGLSVVLDTSEFISVSVATLKGKDAKPTHAGRLRAGGGTNAAGDKPEGSDIRLRFAVAPSMPARGEPPTYFHAAGENKVTEITSPNAAEFIYTGGTVTLTVSSDGKTVVLSPK